jgi:hypothetical protein
VVRVPGYGTGKYCVSCEVRTEFNGATEYMDLSYYRLIPDNNLRWLSRYSGTAGQGNSAAGRMRLSEKN